MTKNTGYARNIFFSLIISVIILLGIGFISVKYLIPLYDLQSQDIYQFMVYVLPIIIGITFIEIGSSISSKTKMKEDDLYDQLPRNSYDAPLYTDIKDDPQRTDYMNTENRAFNPINQSDVEANEPTSESLFDTIATPVNTTFDGTDSNLSKPLMQRMLSMSDEDAERALTYLENDSSFYESNLETTTAEKLLTLNEEDANKLLYWLEQDAVLIDSSAVVDSNIDERQFTDPNSVILPFDKDTTEAIVNFSPTQAKSAVEYVLNGSKTGFIPVPFEGDFDGSFNAILQTEITNAKDFGYEVSLIFMIVDNVDCTHDFDIFVDNIKNACFNFSQEDGSIYLIFPLFNEKEAIEMLNETFEKINHSFKYGITTVKERYNIDVKTLMDESLESYNSQN